MKYTNVVLARTDPKTGNFIQTKAGKSVMKHMLKAIRAKAQVTMTQRIEGSHVPVTVYDEWRRTYGSSWTDHISENQLEREVTQTWKEVRSSRQAVPDMKILADIEIID